MMRMLMMMALVGCASSRTAEANTAYGAQLAACVEHAKTRDAGLACLDRVDEAWSLRDGGQ